MEPTLWQTLAQLAESLGTLLVLLGAFAAQWVLLILWVAWWLFGVNWRRCWGILAAGGWAPLLLLMLLGALAWSRLQPVPCECLPAMLVPNFWWQLLAVTLLVTLALFCGWVQGIFHWAPAEINLDPPVHDHDDGHGHGHGHAENAHS